MKSEELVVYSLLFVPIEVRYALNNIRKITTYCFFLRAGQSSNEL